MKLFHHDSDWQFPAITEKHAYQQIKQWVDSNDTLEFSYFAFPWATLFDTFKVKGEREANRLRDALSVLNVKNLEAKTKTSATVCQHIRMLDFQQLFSDSGITDIFWTHAIKGQDKLPLYPNIKIHPFPLYPVQAMGVRPDFLAKDILYSFVGAKANRWYLTQSRTFILDTLANDLRGVVVGRDNWHYNKIVYDHQIKKTAADETTLVDGAASDEFTAILKRSIFSLCPSGSGPNSIRLWESLGHGAIPVVLADTYLPPGNAELWAEGVVFCGENQESISALPDLLEKISKDTQRIERMRNAMAQLWLLYGPDSFVYDIKRLALSTQKIAEAPDGHKTDIVLNSLVTKVLEDQTIDSQAARMLLLTCTTRILSSVDEFTASMSLDKKIKLACQKARRIAPAETVKHFDNAATSRRITLL